MEFLTVSKNAYRRNTIIYILVLGFALRVVWSFFAQTIQISDFSDYVQRALNFSEFHSILNMGSPQYLRVPGWPIFLSIFSFGHLTNLVVVLICIVTSTSLVYFSCRLLNSIGFSKKSSDLFALVIAIFPPFIQFSSVAAAEHLAILSLVLGCIFYFEISYRGHVFNFLKGVCLAVPILVRPEYVFITPLFLFLLLSIQRCHFFLANSKVSANSIDKQGVLLQIFGYLTVPLVWMFLILIETNGSSFGLTTSLGCNLLMSINPARTYAYSALYAPYCDTFHSQKEAIRIVIQTVLSQPASLLNSVFRGLNAFFSTPSNYGSDWGFTCGGQDFCASKFRGSWRFGQIAEDFLRVLNNFLLLGMYFLSGIFSARAKVPNGSARFNFILAIAIFFVGYFVYAALLAPFHVRYRFLFDWVWLLLLVSLNEFAGLRKKSFK